MFLTLWKNTQKVRVGGIDQPDADVMQMTDTHLAIKVPGRNYTSNSNPGIYTEYIPVEMQVWEIQKVDDHGEACSIIADKILSFPVTKKKK